MEILSRNQHGAFTAGRIPAVEEFAEGLWAVPMALPGAYPGGTSPFSFAYAIDDFSGGIHVIDPGWNLPENLRRWEEFLAGVGKEVSDVATVTVTHLHHDHLGLAEELSSLSGAPIVMHEQEATTLVEAAAAAARGDVDAANRAVRVYSAMTPERLDHFHVPESRWEELQWVPTDVTFPRPQTRVEDGDTLPVAGREITVLWTPGHTGGHMCLVEDATQVVFTADHVLPGINSGIGLGGQSPATPVADYLNSLERMTAYDSYAAAPGHEYRFRGVAERARVLMDHHLRRSREVAAAMQRRSTIWDIAAEVTWSDGFDGLRSYKLGSALSQVAMHMEFIERESESARWL